MIRKIRLIFVLFLMPVFFREPYSAACAAIKESALDHAGKRAIEEG